MKIRNLHIERMPSTRYRRELIMQFTEELFQIALPGWKAQLKHPFVQGIKDGSLDEEKFKRWVIQDYLFLKEFARIFAWAVAKSSRLREMSWYAAMLDLTLNTEMELHRKYAKRFEISTETLETASIWPTTQYYTDFLVRTAADGEMADLVAALLPCAWGYVFIALRIAEHNPPDDQRYADWITQYASKEFEEVSAWLQDEMNRLAEFLGRERKKRIKELFLISTMYELRFWQMCWEGEEWETDLL